jgi:hypothetical protein
MLRVRDWAGRFENSRTRELRSLAWLPVSTDLSSDIYTAILDHKDGAAHYGAAVALYIVASKSTPRGDLRREDGRAHTAESLARVVRMPRELIQDAIQRLIEIGDIEVVKSKSSKIKRPTWRQPATMSHHVATTPHDVATPRQLSALEQKGTEGKESSSEGKEKNGTATPEGTEPRARETATIEQPPAATPSNSQNHDDDDDLTPEQKLFGLFERNGEALTADTLQRIREHLEVREIDLKAYVQALAPKLKPNGHIISPTAIALDLAKKFGSKTRPAQMPAKEKKSCPNCHTLDTGRGLVLSDDGLKLLPCPTCATPEFKQSFEAKEDERAARRLPRPVESVA